MNSPDADTPTPGIERSTRDFTRRDALCSLVMVTAAVAGVIVYLSRPDPTAPETAWICFAAGGAVLLVNQVRRAGRPRSHPGTLLAIGGMSLVVLSLAADSLSLGSGNGIGVLQVMGALAGGAAATLGIRQRLIPGSAARLDDVDTWLVPRVLAASIAIVVIVIVATNLANGPACPPGPDGEKPTAGYYLEDTNHLWCTYTGGGL